MKNENARTENSELSYILFLGTHAAAFTIAASLAYGYLVSSKFGSEDADSYSPPAQIQTYNPGVSCLDTNQTTDIHSLGMNEQ